MTRERERQRFDREGYVLVPDLLDGADLAPSQRALPSVFPTAEEFHGDVDRQRNEAFRDDQFAGIIEFPFSAVDLSLLAVHPKVVALAASLLDTTDIRTYGIEAWAKYSGAVDYDQDHHRDYLGHTLMVPSSAPEHRQLEMFLYLHDVDEDLGPTHVVSRQATAGIAPLPNWLPRADRPEADGRLHGRSGSPALFADEVSAAGKAGTALAYTPGTFHRATNLTRPGGARFTIHINFRRAETEWANRHGWAYKAFDPAWHAFVERATPAQLELFGWPRPGHSYWTEETLAGTALRYPGLDLTPWKDE